jgi:hypothetical protein
MLLAVMAMAIIGTHTQTNIHTHTHTHSNPQSLTSTVTITLTIRLRLRLTLKLTFTLTVRWDVIGLYCISKCVVVCVWDERWMCYAMRMYCKIADCKSLALDWFDLDGCVDALMWLVISTSSCHHAIMASFNECMSQLIQHTIELNLKQLVVMKLIWNAQKHNHIYYYNYILLCDSKRF